MSERWIHAQPQVGSFNRETANVRVAHTANSCMTQRKVTSVAEHTDRVVLERKYTKRCEKGGKRGMQNLLYTNGQSRRTLKGKVVNFDCK